MQRKRDENKNLARALKGIGPMKLIHSEDPAQDTDQFIEATSIVSTRQLKKEQGLAINPKDRIWERVLCGSEEAQTKELRDQRQQIQRLEKLVLLLRLENERLSNNYRIVNDEYENLRETCSTLTQLKNRLQEELFNDFSYWPCC